MVTKQEYIEALERMKQSYYNFDGCMSAMNKFKEDIDLLKGLVNEHFDEKQDEKKETNLDHYKREILEDCLQNLAIVDGRPKRCNSISCCDCEFNNDGPIECHKKVMDWLKQPHIKPTYKLTKFEKDLLKCYLDTYMFKELNTLRVMKEKGYFNDVYKNESIKDILANCEVIK